MIIIRVPMNLATGFYCSTTYLLIFVYPLIARHDKKNVRFLIRQWSNMVSIYCYMCRLLRKTYNKCNV